MILEIADFRTKAADDYEAAMTEVAGSIAASAGHLGHSVQRSLESPDRYVLIVRWESLEAHQGFRSSDRFKRWATRPKDHRDGVVAEHFVSVVENGWSLAE